MLGGFLFFSIPDLDRHLRAHYGAEFEAYMGRTRSFAPFLYCIQAGPRRDPVPFAARSVTRQPATERRSTQLTNQRFVHLAHKFLGWNKGFVPLVLPL